MVGPVWEPDDMEAWKAAVANGGIPGNLFDKTTNEMHGPIDDAGIKAINKEADNNRLNEPLIDISVDTFRAWLEGVEPFDITGAV